jgi:hypothetical protein
MIGFLLEPNLNNGCLAIRNINVVRFGHDPNLNRIILFSRLLYDCYIIIMTRQLKKVFRNFWFISVDLVGNLPHQQII